MPTTTNKIAIEPVTYFKGTATRAEARWVTTHLGIGNASVDLHLWATEDTEIDSKVIAIPSDIYDAWVDDAEFLGHVVELAGLTPVEPVVWVEIPDVEIPEVEAPEVEIPEAEPVGANAPIGLAEIPVGG